MRQRRLIQPAFHHSRVAGYGDVIVAEVLRMIDKWDEGVACRPPSRDAATYSLRSLVPRFSGPTSRAKPRTCAPPPRSWSRCFRRELVSMERATRIGYYRSGPAHLTPIRKRLDVSLARIISDRRTKDAGDDLLAMLLSAQDDARPWDESQTGSR